MYSGARNSSSGESFVMIGYIVAAISYHDSMAMLEEQPRALLQAPNKHVVSQ